jgi:hypothetical protein
MSISTTRRGNNTFLSPANRIRGDAVLLSIHIYMHNGPARCESILAIMNFKVPRQDLFFFFWFKDLDHQNGSRARLPLFKHHVRHAYQLLWINTTPSLIPSPPTNKSAPQTMVINESGGQRGGDSDNVHQIHTARRFKSRGSGHESRSRVF